MNKFITIALVLFAAVVGTHSGAVPYGPASGPYAGPSVQQVDLSSLSKLANIEQYLNGASSSGSYGASAPSYHHAAAPVSYAPATSVVVAAPAQSYGAAPAQSYGAAPAQSYGAAPVQSYRAAPAPSYGSAPAYGPAPAPKYTVQPQYATQLYPGQHNYKSYQSPPQYSTVALPVAPSDPVAKLYVPQQQQYAAPSYAAPTPSYAAPSKYASAPISLGSGY